MSQRITHKGRSTYNTKSNQFKKVRTPSGELVMRYVKKVGFIPKCGGCKETLIGLKRLRAIDRMRVKKSQCTVSRPYGGVLCVNCVEMRILKAIEAEKTVEFDI